MYTDIWTMPIYNWFKVLDTGNLGFIFTYSTNIAPKKVEFKTSDKLFDMWYELNNQFFDEFGQNSQSITLLEKKRDLGLLNARYLETGNKMNLTLIEIKKNEIEGLTNKDDSFLYNKEIGIIAKFIGIPINTRSTSVYEYSDIKKTLQDG